MPATATGGQVFFSVKTHLWTASTRRLVQRPTVKATVLGQRERLRLGGLRCHVGHDGCFLVAIETQGLLLICSFESCGRPSRAPGFSDHLSGNHPEASSGRATIQRDRHLRWFQVSPRFRGLHQRSWMTRRPANQSAPPIFNLPEDRLSSSKIQCSRPRGSEHPSRSNLLCVDRSRYRRGRPRPSWTRWRPCAGRRPCWTPALALFRASISARRLPSSLSVSNERRPMVPWMMPALSTRNWTWPALAFLTAQRRRGHGADLWVRHQAAQAEDLTQGTDDAPCPARR